MFSLTAATLDIASNGMEALSFAQKAEKIKIYGAFFAVAGSTLSFVLSVIDVGKAIKKKDAYALVLSLTKLTVSFFTVAAGLGLLLQMPALSNSRIVIQVEKTVILNRLMTINAIRSIGMWSWIGIAITLIDFMLTTYVFRTDIEKWCDKSMFGKKSSSKFSSLKEENEFFNEAIQSL